MAEPGRRTRTSATDRPQAQFAVVASKRLCAVDQWDKNTEMRMNGSELQCISVIIGAEIRKLAVSDLSDRYPDTEKHATAVPAKW